MISNIKKVKRDSGFTIVELLVVIVVIGILAAITIISYGGVTNKAYTSTAQTAADAVENKSLAFFTESSSNWYPTTYATLSATANVSWYLPPSTATLVTTAIASAPATTAANSINMTICGGILATPTIGPLNAAAITAPFGIKVAYWNYTTPGLVTDTEGNVATGPAAVTSGGVAYTTACWLAQS